MRDGIRLYNMQVARKFAEILSLVQFPHAVEQCFPVGRREQLQAFLVACIRLAEKRVVTQSCGQKQPRAAVELAHGVRRHGVDKTALDPLVTDTAGIGRRLDLLGESVRAADTRQQIGELAFGEMCQLIEPDDIVFRALVLGHIAFRVAVPEFQRRTVCKIPPVLTHLVLCNALRIQPQSRRYKRALQLRHGPSQHELP